jgi:hypothetical protein
VAAAAEAFTKGRTPGFTRTGDSGGGNADNDDGEDGRVVGKGSGLSACLMGDLMVGRFRSLLARRFRFLSLLPRHIHWRKNKGCLLLPVPLAYTCAKEHSQNTQLIRHASSPTSGEHSARHIVQAL